ncbi:MAG: metalloregulator ArsR/SmtB family transcription factor [bacterium]|nr:metalloregulator ArsR/SmtB family transcription factor [bacterium]
MFAALGDATRLELVSRLSDGERHSITELTAGLALSRQAVTKHLRVLDDAGLVNCERVGRESRFAIRPKAVADARDYLTRIATQWDASIARLRRLVEE